MALLGQQIMGIQTRVSLTRRLTRSRPALSSALSFVPSSSAPLSASAQAGVG